MNFEFFALKFSFRAKDSIFFARGKSANILRGTFGTLFQEHPAYKDFFEPAALENAPSGLKNLPRPFVFRTSHLDGAVLAPETEFYFQINVFCALEPARQYFTETFSKLSEVGIGPRRGRAELLSVETEAVAVSLEPEEEVTSAIVHFLTPTELKGEGTLVQQPEFPILFARARDRVSTLREFYGPGALPIEFSKMGKRAMEIRMTTCKLRQESVERRSSKTGQTHPLGGFSGEAHYEGRLAEFMPILRAAQHTGVGRQTVWGKGQIEVITAFEF
jgi:hypothetical protein